MSTIINEYFISTVAMEDKGLPLVGTQTRQTHTSISHGGVTLLL